jgi:hypothetical protein
LGCSESKVIVAWFVMSHERSLSNTGQSKLVTK